MRAVIDTNVLVSALLARISLPAHVLALWRAGGFDMLTATEHLDELMRVSRYPRIRERVSPASFGRLVNELRDVAILVSDLPVVTVCPDRHDNYLLAMAEAGSADFLVTGDKRDLLGLKAYGGARITTVRDFLVLHGRLP